MNSIDELPRNEHAKRAIMIAAAGGHSIVFHGYNNAVILHEFAQSVGIQSRLMRRCSCGEKYCQESVDDLLAWEAQYPLAELVRVNLWVETEEFLQPADVQFWTERAYKTPWVKCVAKIQNSTRYSDLVLDKDSQALLVAALKNLPTITPQRVLAVARTVANLDKRERIKMTDVAEALVYRPLPVNLWTDVLAF